MNKTQVGAVCALTFALGQAACGAPQKHVYFDMGRPIDVKSGHYEQDGQIIPGDQLADALEKEPDSASAVSRAKTFRTLATVLASVGGALIGWPLGQYLGGEPHPLWGLAYAGLGTSGVALAFGFGSSGAMSSAVEAHNQQERFRSPPAASPTPSSTASPSPQPKSDAPPALVPGVEPSAPAAAPNDGAGAAGAPGS